MTRRLGALVMALGVLLAPLGPGSVRCPSCAAGPCCAQRDEGGRALRPLPPCCAMSLPGPVPGRPPVILDPPGAFAVLEAGWGMATAVPVRLTRVATSFHQPIQQDLYQRKCSYLL